MKLFTVTVLLFLIYVSYRIEPADAGVDRRVVRESPDVNNGDVSSSDSNSQSNESSESNSEGGSSTSSESKEEDDSGPKIDLRSNTSNEASKIPTKPPAESLNSQDSSSDESSAEHDSGESKGFISKTKDKLINTVSSAQQKLKDNLEEKAHTMVSGIKKGASSGIRTVVNPMVYIYRTIYDHVCSIMKKMYDAIPGKGIFKKAYGGVSSLSRLRRKADNASSEELSSAVSSVNHISISMGTLKQLAEWMLHHLGYLEKSHLVSQAWISDIRAICNMIELLM